MQKENIWLVTTEMFFYKNRMANNNFLGSVSIPYPIIYQWTLIFDVKYWFLVDNHVSFDPFVFSLQVVIVEKG